MLDGPATFATGASPADCAAWSSASRSGEPSCSAYAGHRVVTSMLVGGVPGHAASTLAAAPRRTPGVLIDVVQQHHAAAEAPCHVPQPGCDMDPYQLPGQLHHISEILASRLQCVHDCSLHPVSPPSIWMDLARLEVSATPAGPDLGPHVHGGLAPVTPTNLGAKLGAIGGLHRATLS